jgi:hypothetical protein
MEDFKKYAGRYAIYNEDVEDVFANEGQPVGYDGEPGLVIGQVGDKILLGWPAREDGGRCGWTLTWADDTDIFLPNHGCVTAWFFRFEEIDLLPEDI